MKTVGRRKFIFITASALGSFAVSSVFDIRAFAAKNRIRHFWWGNPGRDKRTFKVKKSSIKKIPILKLSAKPLHLQTILQN